MNTKSILMALLVVSSAAHAADSEVDKLATLTSVNLALVSAELKYHQARVEDLSAQRIAVTRALNHKLAHSALDIERELTTWRHTGDGSVADAVLSIRNSAREVAAAEERVQAEQHATDTALLGPYKPLSLPTQALDAAAMDAAQLGKRPSAKERATSTLEYLRKVRDAYRATDGDAPPPATAKPLDIITPKDRIDQERIGS